VQAAKRYYKHQDEGLTAHSHTHPRVWSDGEFRKAIQLQVTEDDNLANRRLHITFTAFSNRDSALKWTQNWQKRDKQSAITIAHIDPDKLGNPNSRGIYHAADMIKELRMPLKQGQQISQIYHEYIILHRVPAEAIMKIEDLTPHIVPSVESKATQQSVESGSPTYIHTGFAMVGR
jgi:hypothetical protein